jgi:HlyD family secretion protein
MSKKKIIAIVVGLFVVVVVILNLTSNTTNATKVTAAEAAEQDLEEVVSASGRIQPTSKVDITSEVNGEIISLPVQEGQRVELGELLVVLDTVQVRSGVDQAKYAVDEISARVEGMKATLDQREEEFERQKRLFEQGLVSDTEFKDARYAYLNAKSSYGAAQAQLQQAKARYDQQLDVLRKAKIVAPMPGIITYLDAEVGEVVAPQTIYSQGKTLMTISNLDVFEVEVEVDETEINKVELGQKAEIEVDAFPDTTFNGEVVEIGNTAITQNLGSQDQSTNFRVKVVFEDTDVEIRPGMSATVDITTARRENVLAVPFSAVVMRNLDPDSLEAARSGKDSTGSEGSVGEVQAAETTEAKSPENKARNNDVEREDIKGVFAIRDGKAHFIPVETGISDARDIEIISGLKKDDTVIAGPFSVLRHLRDGEAVEVTKQRNENTGV